MNILLICPPRQLIRPLIDAGHDVALIDAMIDEPSFHDIVSRSSVLSPAIIILGQCGSSAADPVVRALTRRLRHALPQAVIVYGGGYPGSIWRDILLHEPQIDIVVRGEGDEAALVSALQHGEMLDTVMGIAFRTNRKVIATAIPSHPQPVSARNFRTASL